MKCLKCSAEIPDVSSFCPLCGEVVVKQGDSIIPTVVEGSAEEVIPVPIVAAATSGSVVGDVPASQIPEGSASQIPEGSSSVASENTTQSSEKKASPFVGLGAFFKSYFKDPIQTVVDHSSIKYWLWGLLVPIIYVVLNYIVSMTNISFVTFGGVMSQLFTKTGYSISIAIRFATFIFAYFLLQKLFKIEKKKSIKEVISVTGLAFWPIIPGYLVQILFSRVDFLRGFSYGIELAVYAVAAVILFEEMKRFTEDKNLVKTFLCVIIPFASMPVIEHYNDMIINLIAKIFNLF
jgi:hypothetical protein